MADFAYNPDFDYSVHPRFNVARTKFENQVEQRRLISGTKLRKYVLEFRNRVASEMTAVQTFFDSKYESLTQFSIDINGEEVTGIIVPGSFRWSRHAPNVYTYGFEFEEVIDQ